MAITSIEDLSKKIFHQIFDYLVGYDVLKAFSSLNHRFEEFLYDPSFLYQIKVSSSSDKEFINHSKAILRLNKHQIVSLNLCSSVHLEEFLSMFVIDSSLDRLESIGIQGLKRHELPLFLKNLTCLPRLVSLTIQTCKIMLDLSDVYRFIFALPVLKYVKVICNDYISLDPLPPATTNEQFSPIEYLLLDHRCTFNQLDLLLSYTPELRYLHFQHDPDDDDDDNDLNVQTILSRPLANLTHLSLEIDSLEHTEFEIFMKKIASKVKLFHVSCRCDDFIYLGPSYWEQLITKLMPQLEKFHFKYFEEIDFEERSENPRHQSDQFTSSFWTDRQWVFQAEINTYEIIYSICSYKKTWYTQSDLVPVGSKTGSGSSALKILETSLDGSLGLLLKNISWVSSLTRIYHLQLYQKQILVRQLMKILNLLSDLDSLRLCSLSASKPSRSSSREKQLTDAVINKNQITKVYLENCTQLSEVLTLIDLFPRMKYLQVGRTSSIDMESFVRILLIKINEKSNCNLRSLCLSILMADDQMVEKIQTLIDLEKLLCNYRIKRVYDQIYLQWN